MKPIRLPEMTDTLVGEEGSDVEPLPVLVENGMTTSVWELDREDRLKVAEGGHIGLMVLSHPHAPVALGVAAPRCERCGEPMTWESLLGIYVCAEHEEDDA